MPLNRALLAISGCVALAAAWSGVAAVVWRPGFASHMAAHLAIVCGAAPLLALAVAGTRGDCTRLVPVLFAAVPASLLEMAVVWGWHAPAAHDAAQSAPAIRAAEQAWFLVAGVVLWLSVLGKPGRHSDGAGRTAAGVIALLLTSMHMTLLGALLTLAPRRLYAAAGDFCASDATALADQQIGGTMMLIVGGLTYLVGGLALTARLLRGGAGAPLGGLRSAIAKDAP